MGPTLRRSSMMRLVADSSGIVLGALGAMVTTRVLGPSGQGQFALLTLLTSLAILVATVGLADAAVVLVGRGRATLTVAAETSLAIVLGLALVGGLVVFLLGTIELDPTSPRAWAAVAVAAVNVPVAGAVLMFSGLLNAQQRVDLSATVTMTLTTATFVGLLVFVLGLGLGLLGGILASLLATLSALCVSARWLRRSGSLRPPRIHRAYVRPALGLGVRLQVISLLSLAANRIDLLIVFSYTGSAAAGHYSVALTTGLLATMIPYSLTQATFPRLAASGHETAHALEEHSFRIALAACTASAAALAAAIPVLIPLVFGERYSESVVPAELLLPGAVFVSAQWVIAKARAATGDTRLLMASFAANLVVMVGADLILVPASGIRGAAIGSSLGGLAAMLVCLVSRRRSGRSLAALVPRPSDYAELAAFAAGLVRRGAAAVRKSQ